MSLQGKFYQCGLLKGRKFVVVINYKGKLRPSCRFLYPYDLIQTKQERLAIDHAQFPIPDGVTVTFEQVVQVKVVDQHSDGTLVLKLTHPISNTSKAWLRFSDCPNWESIGVGQSALLFDVATVKDMPGDDWVHICARCKEPRFQVSELIPMSDTQDAESRKRSRSEEHREGSTLNGSAALQPQPAAISLAVNTLDDELQLWDRAKIDSIDLDAMKQNDPVLFARLESALAKSLGDLRQLANSASKYKKSS